MDCFHIVSKIVRLFIILSLISFYLIIAACKQNSGAQISDIKSSTPSEAVFSFIESAERGDIAAVTHLISDVPESFKDRCREDRPVDKLNQQRIRVEDAEDAEDESPAVKSKKLNNQGGPFLRVKAKSEDQRLVYEMANHIQINTYFDTVSKLVTGREMNDEALVLIKRGDADDSITLLMVFYLVKKNQNWKIFSIGALYALEDLKKVTYGAKRPTCRELNDLYK